MASDDTKPWAKDQEWRRESGNAEYLITARIDLLDHDFICTAFGSEEMYWAKPIPMDQIAAMLTRSTTLGLYKVLPSVPDAKGSNSPPSPRTPSPTTESTPAEKLEQVGMARFITDQITTAYLTDVYLLPEHRAQGLGRWLIACCREIMEALPAFRRGLLMTSPNVGENFYKRELGFYDIHEERDQVVCMTKRMFKLAD